MFIGIQIVIIMFLLIMMYLTHLNYKRKNYGSRSFISWMTVWVAGILIIMFPQTLMGITQALNLMRVSDLLFVIGFMTFSVVLFKVYVDVKKTKEQTEKLVRTIAIKNPEKKR